MAALARRLAALGAAAVALAACGASGRELQPPSPNQTASILTTPSTSLAVVTGSGDVVTGPLMTAPWPDGGAIPAKFTCKGEDVSPAVGWSTLPPGTAEVAITMTDTDANNFVHWVVAGLDPDVGQVPQDGVPEQAAQSHNDFGTVGYKGPCPPSGTHHYALTLYALKATAGIADGGDPRQAIAQLEKLQLSTATTTGTFGG